MGRRLWEAPRLSGRELGEAVGWHVILWDRCPYKKRRGHRRRVQRRLCEEQGPDGRPQAGSRGLARTRPADGSVRGCSLRSCKSTVCSSGPWAVTLCHGSPGRRRQHSFLPTAVHPVWEQECPQPPDGGASEPHPLSSLQKPSPQ